jgi:hypothetical protein
MPNDPGPTGSAGLEGLEREPATAPRAGWGFIALYTLAYISTSLLFLAPLLVTLALWCLPGRPAAPVAGMVQA